MAYEVEEHVALLTCIIELTAVTETILQLDTGAE